MKITQLHPQLSVGAQITLDDIRPLAASGFTDIVCNRPDSEVSEELLSGEFSNAAKAAGLRFHYRPIDPGAHAIEQGQFIAAIVRSPDARVFAYCRSGARSTLAWSLANQHNNKVSDG